jgi:hypothetical protein
VINATHRSLYLRERDQLPIVQEAGLPQGRSRRVRRNSPPPGFSPRTVQFVASRYSDYAIPAHYHEVTDGYLGDTTMRNWCQPLCLCAPPFPFHRTSKWRSTERFCKEFLEFSECPLKGIV